MRYEIFLYLFLGIYRKAVSMSRDSVLYEKSKAFSKRIVMLYRHLMDEHKEFVLSKQVLRSGTSIGANITEAIYAGSRKDFLARLHIAQK